jgi:hypothetical protein
VIPHNVLFLSVLDGKAAYLNLQTLFAANGSGIENHVRKLMKYDSIAI